MFLSFLLDTWYLREKQLKENSANCIRRSLRSFELWLGKPPESHHLNDADVSGWLMWLEQRAAARTVYGYRSNLMTLWRYAVERGEAIPPRRVRKVRKPKPAPRAWTEDEWRRVLKAADAMPGAFPDLNVRYCEYFGTMFRCAYDSGLRRGDLMKLRKKDVDPSGQIRVIQSKTGDVHWPMFRPQTLTRFQALPSATPLAWRGHITGFYYHVRKIRKAARVSAGALHQTRRTGATLVMKQTESVEKVRQYLGHRSQEMWRAYVDMAIAGSDPVLPPNFE